MHLWFARDKLTLYTSEFEFDLLTNCNDMASRTRRPKCVESSRQSDAVCAPRQRRHSLTDIAQLDTEDADEGTALLADHETDPSVTGQ